MCKKTLCFITLLLAAVPAAWGVVVGNFETGLDGWWSDDATLSQDAAGASVGSSALKAVKPVGWKQVGKLNAKPHLALLATGPEISMDVTVFAADMDGSWMNAEIVINGQNNNNSGANNNIGWKPLGSQDLLRDGMTHTYTWTIDPALAQLIAGADNTIQWFELVIVMNDNAANPVTAYVDNVQITPLEEPNPASIPLVIGDWEEGLEGWTISMPHSFTTAGVTLGDHALALETSPDTWNQDTVFNAFTDPNVMAALRNGRYIEVDLTRRVADFPGGAGHSGFHFIINSGGADYNQWITGDYLNWWIPSNGDQTTTVRWEYLNLMEQLNYLNGATWFELRVVPNWGGGTTGVYILDNMRIVPRLQATLPSPADGVTDLHHKVVLDWYEAAYNKEHQVYISNDLTAIQRVNQGNLANYPQVDFYTTEESMVDMGSLELGKTYYWRVDEVGDDANNIGTEIGRVWTFSIRDNIAIDDFESYADYAAFKLVWADRDANDLSTDIVHEGANAMKVLFDNRVAPYYNEVGFELPAEMTDLTQEGVRGLGVYFYGDPNNQGEPMYAMLEDSQGRSSIVFYDGDPANLSSEEWHLWQMGLPWFDVDLTDVKRIAFGFGDPTNPAPGTHGLMYFDDIFAFQPRCLKGERTAGFAAVDFAPRGLSAGDCEIGYAELLIMAADWLKADTVLPAGDTDPNAVGGGLLAHYAFDEITEEVVDSQTVITTPDSTGNSGHTGTLRNGVTQVSPGYDGTGSAIKVDGTAGSMVDIGTWDPGEQMTISLWIKWSGSSTPGTQGIIGKRDAWASNDAMRWFLETGPTGSIRFRQFSDAGYDIGWGTAGALNSYIGTWMHLAVTLDGTTARIYTNGTELVSGPFQLANKASASMGIGNTHGAGNTGSNEVFNGQIDEVKIFSRALSVEEVRYLADLTPGDGQLHLPVASPAELSSDEPAGQKSINLRDFAVLASYWLGDQNWPY